MEDRQKTHISHGEDRWGRICGHFAVCFCFMRSFATHRQVFFLFAAEWSERSRENMQNTSYNMKWNIIILRLHPVSTHSILLLVFCFRVHLRVASTEQTHNFFFALFLFRSPVRLVVMTIYSTRHIFTHKPSPHEYIVFLVFSFSFFCSSFWLALALRSRALMHIHSVGQKPTAHTWTQSSFVSITTPSNSTKRNISEFLIILTVAGSTAPQTEHEEMNRKINK